MNLVYNEKAYEIFNSNGIYFLKNVVGMWYDLGHSSSLSLEQNFTSLKYDILKELHDATLTDDERTCISKIKSMAKLFTVGKNTFCSVMSNEIVYYGIEIECVLSNRMNVAKCIHNLFAKYADYNTIIVYKHKDCFLISVDVNTSTNKRQIIFSEWLNENSDDELLCNIDISNLSAESTTAFLKDIQFAVAPEYLKYPECVEYLPYNNGNESLKNTTSEEKSSAEDYIDYLNGEGRVSRGNNDDDIATELAMLALSNDDDITQQFFDDSVTKPVPFSSSNSKLEDTSILRNKEELYRYLED